MSSPLFGRGSVSHSMVGRYTQARQMGVKGQDSKTLVTACTIKRPLPCPVEGMEKQRVYLTTGKEKQSKRKKKKDKNENREKRKEN